MLSLSDEVRKLHLVGESSEQALLRLGIHTVADLLYHFPRDWQDLSSLQKIAQIVPGQLTNLRARILKLQGHRTPRRRMYLTQALLEDDTGTIQAVWYNQPYLKNVLKQGVEYYLSGKAAISPYGKSKSGIVLQNPAFELVKSETIHTAGIVPIYELTEGITQKQTRYFLSQAIPFASKIPDLLPSETAKRLGLCGLEFALKNIHFPKDQKSLQAARNRLVFEELFVFQLALLSFKQKIKTLPAPQIPIQTTLIKKFVSSLPFSLTNSQRLALWEILKDLSAAHPMNRLLEGEVGSGKTVVAGIAMFEAAAHGYQSVILAPTEILAWQHYQTLKNLFRNIGLEMALLTRSHKIGEISDIADGQAKIIVGTHALLQERVKFDKIGLLVVDEQQRFGVKQRAQLLAPNQHGLVPHLLSMTATPIPRTLALAFYGDLDISILKELPRGRKKVITRLVEPEKRNIAYEFIRKHLQLGRQAYFVMPLIEQSEKLFTKAVLTEEKKIKETFPEFQIAVLHGRLPGEEKKEIMEMFKAEKFQILISTSVIEVGVDVPKATIMVIENAERFGLAQLHQLRGRVGRSDLQSFCLLFAENLNEYTKNRLMAVVNSNDGFELAEKDLELRGAGEIMGTRQSGFIPFKIARLSDKKTIKLAKTEAENLLKSDLDLEKHPLLKQKVEQIARDTHLE